MMIGFDDDPWISAAQLCVPKAKTRRESCELPCVSALVSCSHHGISLVGNGVLQALAWLHICIASQGKNECLDLRTPG